MREIRNIHLEGKRGNHALGVFLSIESLRTDREQTGHGETGFTIIELMIGIIPARTAF